MIIGYGKISRAWRLDPFGGTVSGGDVDVRHALDILARSHPQHEFRLVTRNSGEHPSTVNLPPNVTNPLVSDSPISQKIRTRLSNRPSPIPHADIKRFTDDLFAYTQPLYTDLDAMVMWIGHHGSSNSSIPAVRKSAEPTTRPYDNFVLYCSYILENINTWRDVSPQAREEIWLCPDPRNYLKARDVKWPLTHPIISQYEMLRETMHYRFGDPAPPRQLGVSENGVNWVSTPRYTYDALEITAVNSPSAMPLNTSFDERYDFGMVLNENKKNVKENRAKVLAEWVLANWPTCEIFGKWTDVSLEALGRPDIRECPYRYMMSTLQRWRCTLTTPASGSGWATAKPWECFAAGTVCFFHPEYDDQDHILGDAPTELRQWLRVGSPDQLRRRVEHLAKNEADWRWIIEAQRYHFERRYHESHGGVLAIEKRLGLVS